MERLWSDTTKTVLVAIVVASLMIPGAAVATHRLAEDNNAGEAEPADTLVPDKCDGYKGNGDAGFLHALMEITDDDRAYGKAKAAIGDAKDEIENENQDPDASAASDALDIADRHLVNAGECLDAIAQQCNAWTGFARANVMSGAATALDTATSELRSGYNTVNKTVNENVSDIEDDPILPPYPDEISQARNVFEDTASDGSSQVTFACSQISWAAGQVSAAGAAGEAVQAAKDALDSDEGDLDEALNKTEEAEKILNEVDNKLEQEVTPVIQPAYEVDHRIRKIAPVLAPGGDFESDEGDQPVEVRDLVSVTVADAAKDETGIVDVNVFVEMAATHHEVGGERQHAKQRISFDFDTASDRFRVFAAYEVGVGWSAELQRWDGASESWSEATDVPVTESGTVVAMTLPGGEMDLNAGDVITSTQAFSYEEESDDLSSDDLTSMSLTDDISAKLTISDVVPGATGVEYDPDSPEYGASWEAGTSFDADSDNVPDHDDNCPETYNPDQDPDACDGDPGTDDSEDPGTDPGSDPGGTDGSESNDDSTVPEEMPDSVGGLPMTWLLVIALVAVIAVLVGVIAGRS